MANVRRLQNRVACKNKVAGGHVEIYSEVGSGTTVKLYFPREVATEDALVATASGAVSGGDETILVVKDDDEVREVAIAMLTEHGYRVLKAKDAAAGLVVIDSGIPIGLVFTDVMMPGPLRSPELARKAKEAFLSGRSSRGLPQRPRRPFNHIVRTSAIRTPKSAMTAHGFICPSGTFRCRCEVLVLR